MHRSSSHIGSLHDYKPKKLWKSIVSKDSTNSENSLSRTLSRSASTHTTHSNNNSKKRSSMIISEPTSIRSNGMKRLSTISGFNLLDNTTDLSIDPKERDFYSKLSSNNRHQSVYLQDENQDDADDSGSIHFINMDHDTNQEIDTLSSALEDYKIFTTSKASNTNNNQENRKESRMSSLPSFCSTSTIDSQISVLHVSNSLWIGSTISDLEEEDNLSKAEEEVDYFKEFDSENLFRYADNDNERTHRTSLIFV